MKPRISRDSLATFSSRSSLILDYQALHLPPVTLIIFKKNQIWADYESLTKRVFTLKYNCMIFTRRKKYPRTLTLEKLFKIN